MVTPQSAWGAAMLQCFIIPIHVTSRNVDIMCSVAYRLSLLVTQ